MLTDLRRRKPRRLRVLRATSVSLVIMLFTAACTETLTEPVVDQVGSTLPRVSQLPQGIAHPNVIEIVTRTRTSGAARDFTESRVQMRTPAPSASRRTITVPMRSPAEQYSDVLAGMEELRPDLMAQIKAAKFTRTIEVLEPAVSALALCRDTRAWSQRSRTNSASGYVVSEGQGDSPTLRETVIRDGKVVLLTEMKWRRTRTSWRLTSLLSRAPDNSFSEEVVLRNADDQSAAAARDYEPERVDCANDELSQRKTMSSRLAASLPRASISVPRATLGSALFEDIEVASAENCYGTACEGLYTTWKQQAALLAVLHTVSYGTCETARNLASTPGVMNTPHGRAAVQLARILCAGALAAEAVQLWIAESARTDWWNCIRDSGANQQRAPFLEVPLKHESGLFQVVQGRSGHGSASAAIAPSFLVSALTCDDGGDETGGGGGVYFGGDGNPFGGCRTEVWEISYDSGVSWSPINVRVCDAT